MKQFLLTGVLAVGFSLVPEARQTQAPPPLPMTAADAQAETKATTEKSPAVPEVQKLKIENAVLKVNAAMREYQRIVAESQAIVRAEVGKFEAEHPGWTIDANKLVAVKKPAEKK